LPRASTITGSQPVAAKIVAASPGQLVAPRRVPRGAGHDGEPRPVAARERGCELGRGAGCRRAVGREQDGARERRVPRSAREQDGHGRAVQRRGCRSTDQDRAQARALGDAHHEQVVSAGGREQRGARLGGTNRIDLRANAEIACCEPRALQRLQRTSPAEQRCRGGPRPGLPGHSEKAQGRAVGREPRRLAGGLVTLAATVDAAQDRAEDRARRGDGSSICFERETLHAADARTASSRRHPHAARIGSRGLLRMADAARVGTIQTRRSRPRPLRPSKLARRACRGSCWMRPRATPGAALRARGPEGWSETTFAELGAAAVEIAAGLIGLGIRPGDRVGILAETRPEWTLADIGVLCAGATVVPVYQTCSPQECRYVLEHAGVRVVICEDEAQLAKLERIRDDLPELEHVVTMVPVNGVLSLFDLRDRAGTCCADVVERAVASQTPDDVATIVYTSGTTGPPKGCALTHANCMATMRMYEQQLSLRSGIVIFMFLPLAHVLARMVQLVALDVGATLVYWSRDPKLLLDDLAAARPTHVPSVPRLYEKVHGRALAAISEASPVRRRVFDWSIATGAARRSAPVMPSSIAPPKRSRTRASTSRSANRCFARSSRPTRRPSRCSATSATASPGRSMRSAEASRSSMSTRRSSWRSSRCPPARSRRSRGSARSMESRRCWWSLPDSRTRRERSAAGASRRSAVPPACG